jgi:hypothetical protein
VWFFKKDGDDYETPSDYSQDTFRFLLRFWRRLMTGIKTVRIPSIMASKG